jgi:hypothetical protein
VPVPSWSKQLLDVWLSHSGVSEGPVFRRVSKLGKRQETGATANVVWYAVKRCAREAGIVNLAPHDLRRTCARLCHDCSGGLEQIRFLLGTLPSRQRSDTSGANRNCKRQLMIASKSQSQATPPNRSGPLASPREIGDSVLYHSVPGLASPQQVNGVIGPRSGCIVENEAQTFVNTCRLIGSNLPHAGFRST